MQEKLKAAIEDGNLLDPDETVVIGVSGGPDSLSLLHAMAGMGYRIICAHLDHALRPESEGEAAYVRGWAEKLGAGYASKRVDTRVHQSRKGLSIEEAARDLRYRFLFSLAAERRAQAVLTGHTADDQVETILMHMIRGSGLSGLKGMLEKTFFPVLSEEIPLIRPMLGIWRKEVLAYCRGFGLEPVFDRSNLDTTFFRNRIRSELIPELKSYNPKIKERLLITGKVLAADEADLNKVVDAIWATVFMSVGDGYLRLDAGGLKRISPGLQARVIRRAVRLLNPQERDLDYGAIMRARTALLGDVPSVEVPLVGGLRLYLEERRVCWIAYEIQALPRDDWPQVVREGALDELAVEGEVELAGNWRIGLAEKSLPPAGIKTNPDKYLDWIQVPEGIDRLLVRTRRPGDRFRPLGMGGSRQKLSDFLINRAMPRRLRAGWPLVCLGDEIVWIPGYGINDRFGIGAHPGRVFQLSCKKN